MSFSQTPCPVRIHFACDLLSEVCEETGMTRRKMAITTLSLGVALLVVLAGVLLVLAQRGGAPRRTDGQSGQWYSLPSVPAGQPTPAIPANVYVFADPSGQRF